MMELGDRQWLIKLGSGTRHSVAGPAGCFEVKDGRKLQWWTPGKVSADLCL
jgi:predicted ferric reductase